MTSILGKIFHTRPLPPPLPTKADRTYARAMAVSDDLLRKMHDYSRSNDAALAVMADVWAQNHNVPFMVTVYEAVEEAKSGATYSDSSQQRIGKQP
mgnify:CR=1 FL=1